MSNLKISKLFFSIVPNVMSVVRCHIKKASEPDFGFAQFRVLVNINRGIDNAKHIAELHGVSQAAMSKMVESLAVQGFICREVNDLDRRCVTLKLTGQGKEKIKNIKLAASKKFEPSLKLLSENEKVELVLALECLDSFFKKIQENKN